MDELHLLYIGKDSATLISDLVVANALFLKESSEILEQLRTMWKEAVPYWRHNEEAENSFCKLCKTVEDEREN